MKSMSMKEIEDGFRLLGLGTEEDRERIRKMTEPIPSLLMSPHRMTILGKPHRCEVLKEKDAKLESDIRRGTD